MKKLIWKFKFALGIRRRALLPILFCWDCATVAANDWLADEWQDHDPVAAADEELAGWV